jgi:hypothetical protein
LSYMAMVRPSLSIVSTRFDLPILTQKNSRECDGCSIFNYSPILP